MNRRFLYRILPRTIRPTPIGTRFLILTLGVGIGAINTGNNLLYLGLGLLLSLIVVSGLLSERNLKKLEAARHGPSVITAGRPATFWCSLTNRKKRISAFSILVEECDLRPPVAARFVEILPAATATQGYSAAFPHRGRYRVQNLRLLTTFPFGLFRKARLIEAPAEFLVYPRCVPIAEEDFIRFLPSGAMVPRSKRGQGTGLYNLRPYVPGDEARRVHWKASARHAQLLVREFEEEEDRQIRLVFIHRLAHPERSDEREAFERAVVLTASLADGWLARGGSVRLDLLDRTLPMGTGPQQWDRIMRALALVEPASGSVPRPRAEPDIRSVAILPMKGLVNIGPTEGPVLTGEDLSRLQGEPDGAPSRV
jgi:uncharacterized protein (DUF58 family)